MKSSRRQQLRTNELAQSLAQLVDFLKANSGVVLAGVAAVILVIGLAIYWYSAKVASREQGWTDFYANQFEGAAQTRLANFRNIATKYKDEPLAASAWLNFAEGSLRQAMSGTRAPADRKRLLDQAAGAYNTIISQYPDQVLAVAGARFKLANLAESQRRWEEARQHYQAVASDPRFANMPQRQLAIEATERLAAISQPVVFAKPVTTGPTTRTGTGAASRPAGLGGTARTKPATRPATSPAK